jgi:uncharacterized protein YbcI
MDRPPAAQVGRGERAARISNQMVGLLSRYTGRGPTKTRVSINPDFAPVVLQDTLTEGERNLLAAGQATRSRPCDARSTD